MQMALSRFWRMCPGYSSEHSVTLRQVGNDGVALPPGPPNLGINSGLGPKNRPALHRVVLGHICSAHLPEQNSQGWEKPGHFQVIFPGEQAEEGCPSLSFGGLAVGKEEEDHCLLFLETQPSSHDRCQRRAGVRRPNQVVITKRLHLCWERL